jgi:hypothetical protein
MGRTLSVFPGGACAGRGSGERSGQRGAAQRYLTFCSFCDGAWFPSGNWWGGRELSLIINISQSVRGRGGPSRSLEGGALSGNSTYISYI